MISPDLSQEETRPTLQLHLENAPGYSGRRKRYLAGQRLAQNCPEKAGVAGPILLSCSRGFKKHVAGMKPRPWRNIAKWITEVPHQNTPRTKTRPAPKHASLHQNTLLLIINILTHNAFINKRFFDIKYDLA